ncbi:hypothetical protein [Flammeovirga aprica]|uniref:Uncharacterized protein n=1 Tax=Flammeovirga aprica JL-4 TaxID=694437 RepID=A0A7X9XB58_9BACT|nr:hypothetical protein [Flammeovirga aprica]NME70391.1 hypothetical protein [Flammeovirga aprica JL-4]
MRILILLLLFLSACNIKQPQKETAKKQDQWLYDARQTTLKINDNDCEITIKAVPESHELLYIIKYDGSGYLEPLQLSTIDSRPSAVLVAGRTWIENDTIISKTVSPLNNTLKYTQINESGPLRSHYMISYQEEGQLQYIRFQLNSKVYNYYLETFPYVSNKKSYHLSQNNLNWEEKISAHLKQKLSAKRDIKGAESMVMSENEWNVAGLISHINCVYDGEKLNLEVIWINHTELDLWLTTPKPYLHIDQQKIPVSWTSFEGKLALGKGKRISMKTSLAIDKAPIEATFPVENILFYDEEIFFPKGMQIDLVNDDSI